jgi:hypothetical protein
MRMMKLQKLTPTSKSTSIPTRNPTWTSLPHYHQTITPSKQNKQNSRARLFPGEADQVISQLIKSQPNPPYPLSPPSLTHSTQLNSTPPNQNLQKKLTPSATYHHHSRSSDIGQACTREQRRNPRVGSETHSLTLGVESLALVNVTLTHLIQPLTHPLNGMYCM